MKNSQVLQSTKPTVLRVSNEQVSLNVKVYGIENPETIILLHGGPGVPDDMPFVAEAIKNKYQVVYFDQRGTRLSACKNHSYTMANYLSDIELIANELGLEQFHLFGHSWGGLYAQIYAEEYPHRILSLFLCSPGSGTNKIWKQTEKEVMLFNKKACTKREWFAMGWNSLWGILGSNRAYQKLFATVIRNYSKGFTNLTLQYDLSHINAEPINKTRPQIIKYPLLQVSTPSPFPVMITYGDQDIYGNSKQEVFKRYPNAQRKTIQHCGHIPWHNNSQTFRDVLATFYAI